MGNQKKKCSKCTTGSGDFSLNDFANVAISGKTRMRKQNSTLITKNDDDPHEIVDAENDKILAEQNKIRTRRKKTFERKVETGTNVYPLDIWCILSRYIYPEDVGRFASICSGANQATHCASFWFCLYRRFYKNSKDIPERLLPECMTRLHGLRSCVIRSLYHTYPPLASNYFTDTMKKPVIRCSLSHSQEEKLVLRKCSLVWRESKDWTQTYNFILVRRDPVSRSRISNTVPDFLKTMDNIYANEAEDSVMIQVVSRKYIHTPNVLGYILICVIYDHEKLTMVFSRSTYSSHDNKTVEFKDVEGICIHNWWSPYYQHSDVLITPETFNEKYLNNF